MAQTGTILIALCVFIFSLVLGSIDDVLRENLIQMQEKTKGIRGPNMENSLKIEFGIREDYKNIILNLTVEKYNASKKVKRALNEIKNVSVKIGFLKTSGFDLENEIDYLDNILLKSSLLNEWLQQSVTNLNERRAKGDNIKCAELYRTLGIENNSNRSVDVHHGTFTRILIGEIKTELVKLEEELRVKTSLEKLMARKTNYWENIIKSLKREIDEIKGDLVKAKKELKRLKEELSDVTVKIGELRKKRRDVFTKQSLTVDQTVDILNAMRPFRKDLECYKTLEYEINNNLNE